MSKFVEANEKIAEAVVEGYKKIEQGAVDGFNKVTDKCVEKLFAREGESVEDAKKRLSGESASEYETVEENEDDKLGIFSADRTAAHYLCSSQILIRL